MLVGSYIRAKRLEKRMSQRALAQKLGVSHGAVAQWELDQTKPDPTHLRMLAVVLQAELRMLRAGDGPHPGEFVDDPHELALIDFWRTLDDDNRAFLTHYIALARGQK